MTRQVIVVGNCTLDIAFRLSRFPQPGETLLSDQHARDVGGKGANQAVAAARTGVAVRFCSAVGDDTDGHWLRAQLQREMVGAAHIHVVDAPTDVSIIFVTGDGQNSIVSTHAAAKALCDEDVVAALAELDRDDIVLVQGNLDLPLTMYTLQEAHRRGARTVLNPAPIHYDYGDLWPHVDVAVPNEVEVSTLTATRDIEAGARQLLERGVDDVIVTLGAAGALHVSAAGATQYAAELTEAVDTTGAGDVFCGILAASMAMHEPLDAAIRNGVHAATLSVGRNGTQAAFPSRDELQVLMGDRLPDDLEERI